MHPALTFCITIRHCQPNSCLRISVFSSLVFSPCTTPHLWSTCSGNLQKSTSLCTARKPRTFTQQTSNIPEMLPPSRNDLIVTLTVLHICIISQHHSAACADEGVQNLRRGFSRKRILVACGVNMARTGSPNLVTRAVWSRTSPNHHNIYVVSMCFMWFLPSLGI